MFLLFGCSLWLVIGQSNGQINFYSDVDLFDSGTEFQPANAVELLESIFVSSLTSCGQACNQNVQCRTFDYDLHSWVCRLFEGAVETGQVVPSGSLTSRVGAIHFASNLYTTFGQPCIQCRQSRYLICSSNNTCQCPQNTAWNGVQCINQRYEDANCLNNQWCRNDTGFVCSNLHFCTEYSCGNMTIAKRDLPGNDLTSNRTSHYATCCSWCRNYPACRAFTWIKASGLFFGMCYLKWSSGGSTNSSTDHISAYY